MCTLLLWKRAHPRYPLIAAANRDEFLDRASSPMGLLDVNPVVVGGRDLVAGGTWFAVNAAGIVVALTNRRGAGSHDPLRRSRGMLVLEAARSRDYSDAVARVAAADPSAYNPFVCFVADARNAAAIHTGVNGTRVTVVDDGVHAITNWDLDADEPRKARRALEQARALPIDSHDEPDAIARGLHALLADHGGTPDDDAALCVHRPESAYGTRSSWIVLLGTTPDEVRVFHAEGAPCTAPLEDATALLRHETHTASSNH